MSKKTDKDAREVKHAVEKDQIDNQDFGVRVPDDNENAFKAEYFRKAEDERRIKVLQDYIRNLNEQDAERGALRASYVPSKDDINVLMRKDSELELAQFERFLGQYFNITDPTHLRIIREIYPQYLDRRVELIEKTLDAQKRVALIKLLGVRNKEDLYFLYALYTGQIQVPATAVFDTTQKGDFNRGWLNFKRWTAPERPIQPAPAALLTAATAGPRGPLGGPAGAGASIFPGVGTGAPAPIYNALGTHGF